MKHVVVLPVFLSKITGFAEVTELTKAEHRALAGLHLGGAEALLARRVSSRTISRLYDRGLATTHGLTEYGKVIAKACAEQELESVVQSGNSI